MPKGARPSAPARRRNLVATRLWLARCVGKGGRTMARCEDCLVLRLLLKKTDDSCQMNACVRSIAAPTSCRVTRKNLRPTRCCWPQPVFHIDPPMSQLCFPITPVTSPGNASWAASKQRMRMNGFPKHAAVASSHLQHAPRRSRFQELPPPSPRRNWHPGQPSSPVGCGRGAGTACRQNATRAMMCGCARCAAG